MRKILFIISTILLLNLSLVSAITQQGINEAKSLIDSKTDCKSLPNPHLEIIGEYYMEQMHPGESHDLMHKMMGLQEGSEAEEQFHINMAKTIYCGEPGGMMGGGMMGGMPMMGGGMMNWQTPQTSMMGNGGYARYWNFLNILYIILLIGLIVLVYLWIIKLWRNSHGKKK